MNVTRRNLLRALGLGGSAYFLPWRKRARAATSTIPTRVLFFYTPHGTMLRQWITAPSGASAATETSFGLGPILQPLSAFQPKMTILEGMDYQSTYVDPTAAANGHVNGQTHALSGINRANANSSGGISIDQFIAKGINSPAPVTVIPSLELSSRLDVGVRELTVSWAGSNQLVAPMTDPAAVYTRLFPSGPPTGQGTDSAAATLARRRKSVLDGVLGEFNAVTQSLSSADKARLSSHADLIRNLELQQSLSGAPAGTCIASTQSSVTSQYAADCPKGRGANCLNDSMAAFTNLVVSAFSCDLTRVVTIDVDTFADNLFYDNQAVVSAGGIHGFLHGMDDTGWLEQERYNLHGSVSAGSSDPTNIATANKFFAGYAQLLANLCQQLDAVAEPDGTTLLDHTIVVWCSELGSTNHLTFWVNYLLLGGGAAGIKTGRYVKVPRHKPGVNSNDYFIDSGTPHNNLFVSLANLMGLSSVTTFGNPSVCTGPLTLLQG
jgi:hypothetical protein